jgi:hypothetical protein
MILNILSPMPRYKLHVSAISTSTRLPISSYFLVELSLTMSMSSLVKLLLSVQVMWFGRMVASLYFIGHLGGDELAGAALAITFSSVTG